MSNKSKTYIIASVDIGDGRIDDIRIRKNDNPTRLADSFCEKHNLHSRVKKHLAIQLAKHISKSRQNKPKDQRVKSTYKSSKAKLSPDKAQRLNTEVPKSYQKKRELVQETHKSEGLTFCPKRNLWMNSKRSLSDKKESNELFNRLNGCTFSPVVNDKSKSIDKKAKGVSRTNLLYKDAQTRALNLLDLSNKLHESICPFTPDTRQTAKVNRRILKYNSTKVSPTNSHMVTPSNKTTQQTCSFEQYFHKKSTAAIQFSIPDSIHPVSIRNKHNRWNSQGNPSFTESSPTEMKEKEQKPPLYKSFKFLSSHTSKNQSPSDSKIHSALNSQVPSPNLSIKDSLKVTPTSTPKPSFKTVYFKLGQLQEPPDNLGMNDAEKHKFEKGLEKNSQPKPHRKSSSCLNKESSLKFN